MRGQNTHLSLCTFKKVRLERSGYLHILVKTSIFMKENILILALGQSKLSNTKFCIKKAI